MRTEQQIEAEITKLQRRLKTVRANQKITCLNENCKKSQPLKHYTVVMMYHYVRPYGCCGGDYHNFSEEYLLVCNSCNTFHRIYNTNRYGTATNKRDKRIGDIYNILEKKCYDAKEVLYLYGDYVPTELNLDKLRAEKDEVIW